MVRTPGYDKFGMKKGTWTPEEDMKLKAYITKFGHLNWRQLPKHAGLARCGKSCRLRWINYLRPDVKRGNYSKEEEDIIARLHDKLGNRWSAIAAKLPGRTDNEVENYWHTNLKKGRSKNTSSNETSSNDVSSLHTTSNETNPNDDFSMCTESISNEEGEVDGEQVAEANNMYPQVNETRDAAISHPSQQYCYGDSYSITGDCNQMAEDFSETSDSFWTEPFLSETSLTGNGDFAAMIYPAGFLSPPYYTDFFGGEEFYQYDDLFSSF